MLYITKIDDYLEILTAKEVKNFVVKHFKKTVRKEGNLRKVAKLFLSFYQHNQILLIIVYIIIMLRF